jgi:hypothetical protein
VEPPNLKVLARLVREANDAWDGGEYCALVRIGQRWTVGVDCRGGFETYGREWLPGDGAPLDAVAVARRLLAAFRDATTKQRS